MHDLEPSGGPSSRRFLALAPLTRIVGLASDARNLILAAVGLAALAAGWAGLERAFGPIGPSPIGLQLAPAMDGLGSPAIPGGFAEAARWMAEPALVVVRPILALFRRDQGFGAWSRSALMALWALIVWGIVGGAIARVSAVRAATGGRVGLGTAARFGLRKASSLIGAPLTPLLTSALLAGGCAAFGLATRIPWGVGATIGAGLGFLPLLASLVMALILGGLALGWPLMIATVATEGEDAPDALSRSYAYVSQRLVRYLVHVALAWAIGAAGLVAVIFFARAVLALEAWGVGLGAGDGPPGAIDGLAWWSIDGLARWSIAVGGVVHAWVYAYFWSAAPVLYLILRLDVDGTEWHDVYLPDQDADTFAPDLGPAEVVEAEVS